MSVKGRSKRRNNIVQSRLQFLTCKQTTRAPVRQVPFLILTTLDQAPEENVHRLNQVIFYHGQDHKNLKYKQKKQNKNTNKHNEFLVDRQKIH